MTSLCVIALGLIWGVATLYVLLPLVPTFLVRLGLLQGPVKIGFPYPVEYYIDTDKFFTILYMHVAFTSMTLSTLISAVDSLYYAYALHVCGIFAEVG